PHAEEFAARQPCSRYPTILVSLRDRAGLQSADSGGEVTRDVDGSRTPAPVFGAPRRHARRVHRHDDETDDDAFAHAGHEATDVLFGCCAAEWASGAGRRAPVRRVPWGQGAALVLR